MSHDNHDRDLKRPVYDRYDQISDWYLSARTDAEMEQPYLAKLASSMPANGHLLDIGCGSGRPIADYFIQRGHRVTGVDGSTHLIAAARRQFPGMEWRQEDLRALELNATYDAIVAWGVLFHLTAPEQETLLGLLSRHIKPGAQMLFTTGDAQHEGDADWGEMQGVAFPHFSLDPEGYQAMLDRAQLEVTEMNIKDPACGEQSIWMAQAKL